MSHPSLRRAPCIAPGEEDTCMSYEEEDTCMSYEEEEDTCIAPCIPFASGRVTNTRSLLTYISFDTYEVSFDTYKVSFVSHRPFRLPRDEWSAENRHKGSLLPLCVGAPTSNPCSPCYVCVCVCLYIIFYI